MNLIIMNLLYQAYFVCESDLLFCSRQIVPPARMHKISALLLCIASLLRTAGSRCQLLQTFSPQSVSLNVAAHIQELLMGTGGVFGLTSALVGESLPGSGSSTATGNALNQGPVVFHWPQSVITELESRAHEDGEWLQLLVDLHRYVSLVSSRP